VLGGGGWCEGCGWQATGGPEGVVLSWLAAVGLFDSGPGCFTQYHIANDWHQCQALNASQTTSALPQRSAVATAKDLHQSGLHRAHTSQTHVSSVYAFNGSKIHPHPT